VSFYEKGYDQIEADMKKIEKHLCPASASIWNSRLVIMSEESVQN